MNVSGSEYLKKNKPLYQKLLTKLLDRYPYASILAADGKERSYSVSGRGVSIQDSQRFGRRGFVVRVHDGDGWGEYAANQLTEETIPAVLYELAHSLGAMAPGVKRVISPLPQEEPIRLHESTEYLIHPEELGDEAIVNRLRGIREHAMAQDDRIIDATLRFDYQVYHKLFLSKEKDMEQDVMWSSSALLVLAARGEEIKDVYRSYSNLGGAEVLGRMDEDVEDAAKTVLELLESVPMIPGEYDCICTPEVTGMIVHEAFGHDVEMDMFVKDRALARSYIGKEVASPLVNMHDGAAAAKEVASYFFDDEGNPAQDTLIIENGILKRGISDGVSAARLGTAPTGNGRRESVDHKVYTRMTNTFFEGGSDRVEDMIASIDYGMLLENPSSGMEDPKNWGIQCMVSFAREIRNGKLTGKIFAPVVLTGYVPDLLKSISMISPTVELAGGGACGKGYKEWVKVSDGGPWIKAKIRLG